MTMPHLMNCLHSESGWCLDCVKALHSEYEFANRRIANLEKLNASLVKLQTENAAIRDRTHTLNVSLMELLAKRG